MQDNETLRPRLVDAARACLGTPYVHLGRAAGQGMDCLGLVIHALRCAGLSVQDDTHYKQRPDGKHLMRCVIAHGAPEKPHDEIAAGDVLIFRFDHQPQHFGLATGADKMIHAFAPAGAVVETDLGDYWRARLLHVFAPIINKGEAA